MYEPNDLARYTFLPDAMSTMSELPVSQLVNDDAYLYIIEDAVRRIEAAGTGKKHTGGIAGSCMIAGKQFPTEIVSFCLCLFILADRRLRKLSRAWALAESERAGQRINRDIMGGRIETVKALAFDTLGITIHVGKTYEVGIADYVRLCVGISGATWRLVNQTVDGGKVMLTQHSLVRLMCEGVRLYIAKMFHTIKAVPESRYISDAVEKLSSEYPQDRPLELPKFNPPCISHAIKMLEDNENLSHAGRFLLGTFMLKLGRTVDEVVPYFEGAPDYNEKITRYQLGHIAGKEYMCQSCAAIKTSGLCYETSECAGIKNPIQFRGKS